jgi:hypothetical protein
VIDSIGRKQSRSSGKSKSRIYEKVTISDVVETVTQRVLDAVEEVINDCVTVEPVVVVTRVDYEIGSNLPVYRGSKDNRLCVDSKIIE